MKIISYSAGLSLYDRMPPAAKQALGTMTRLIPRETLLGRGFAEDLKLLRTSEKWSREELERYQVQRLGVLMEHAYRNVPYYHDLFKDAGIRPGDLTTIGSLKRVPVLTKEIVRREFDRLAALNRAEYQAGEANTTGSTGVPLRFLLDQKNREIEHASVWRHYLECGATGLDARIASFRGDFVSDRDATVPWRWDGRLGELTFNTYALSHGNIERMVERLNKFHPQIIRGYPHSLFILARGMELSGCSLSFAPKLIHTSSEQLPAFMRHGIESALETKIYDWYSQSEYVISAGECSEGRYHQVMETGIMNVQEDPWGMERLVGTGLWNFSMPMINYEVGDNVALEPSECPCGRSHLSLRSIEGRLNDIIIAANGTAFSGVGIDNFYEKEVVSRLERAPDFLKLVQEREEAFTVEVFLKQGMLESDLALIKDSFMTLLGPRSELTMKVLDSLPKDRKWKNVESRLSPQTIARLLDERIESEI